MTVATVDSDKNEATDIKSDKSPDKKPENKSVINFTYWNIVCENLLINYYMAVRNRNCWSLTWHDRRGNDENAMKLCIWIIIPCTYIFH